MCQINAMQIFCLLYKYSKEKKKQKQNENENEIQSYKINIIKSLFSIQKILNHNYTRLTSYMYVALERSRKKCSSDKIYRRTRNTSQYS